MTPKPKTDAQAAEDAARKLANTEAPLTIANMARTYGINQVRGSIQIAFLTGAAWQRRRLARRLREEKARLEAAEEIVDLIIHASPPTSHRFALANAYRERYPYKAKKGRGK